MSVTVPGAKAEVGLSKGPFRAARGTQISCKGWQQEAALRMLMNNLDPEVAEKPEELIVYGGTGRAARNWECFHAIVRSLRELRQTRRCWCNRASRWGFFALTNTRRACCCAIPIWLATGTTGTSFMSWTALV